MGLRDEERVRWMQIRDLIVEEKLRDESYHPRSEACQGRIDALTWVLYKMDDELILLPPKVVHREDD